MLGLLINASDISIRQRMTSEEDKRMRCIKERARPITVARSTRRLYGNSQPRRKGIARDMRFSSQELLKIFEMKQTAS